MLRFKNCSAASLALPCVVATVILLPLFGSMDHSAMATSRGVKSSPLRRAANCDGFVGTWKTTCGTLTIEITAQDEKGYTIRGEYPADCGVNKDNRKTGFIQGTVQKHEAGDVFDGKWFNSHRGEGHSSSGPVHFTLNVKGGGFVGYWKEADDKGENPWTGTCNK